ncbi:MAG: hypothetical protein HEQ39_10110 [Rhizobacter sp.]
MARGLSILGGLASGIASGMVLRNQLDKNEADKARAEEERQARLEAKAEQRDNKRLMQDAMRPVEMQSGSGGALKSDAMDNRDVGLPENQALPNAGLSPQAYRVGGKSYVTMQDATAAEQQANSPDARNARVSQALATTQGPMAAMQFDAAGKQAKAADIQIKESEQQQAARTFARGAAEAMAKGDWNGFAQFATDNYADGYTYKATPDPKGGATLTRFDKDGKESGSMPFKSREEAIMLAATRADPTKYAEYVTGRADKEQAQKNNDREFDLRKAANESDASYRSRMLAIQERQDSRAAASHRAAMDSDRLPPAVKMQAQALQEQMKITSTALAKAMAEGQFDANNPGTQKLLEQQAALRLQYGSLLNPQGTGGRSDPLGLSAASQQTQPKAVMGQPSGGLAAPTTQQPERKINYVTMPGNPTEKFAQRQAAARAAQQQGQQEALSSAQSAAQAAIESRDPAAAAAVQDLPGFSLLPIEQKAAIRQVVFGR